MIGSRLIFSSRRVCPGNARCTLAEAENPRDREKSLHQMRKTSFAALSICGGLAIPTEAAYHIIWAASSPSGFGLGRF